MDFWCANRVNSASFFASANASQPVGCDKSGRFVARFLNGLMSYFRRSQLHNPDFSSKILEFTLLGKCRNNLDSATRAKIVESALDSAPSQNLIKKLNKKSLLKFLLLFVKAKRRAPFIPQTLIHQVGQILQIAESNLKQRNKNERIT